MRSRSDKHLFLFGVGPCRGALGAHAAAASRLSRLGRSAEYSELERPSRWASCSPMYTSGLRQIVSIWPAFSSATTTRCGRRRCRWRAYSENRRHLHHSSQSSRKRSQSFLRASARARGAQCAVVSIRKNIVRLWLRASDCLRACAVRVPRCSRWTSAERTKMRRAAAGGDAIEILMT